MIKLATIELIKEIIPHPDFEVEKLELAKVLNFTCIVAKGNFQVGEKVILIQSDSILPNESWSEIYKRFSPNRVKAQKLRGVWSYGIVEKLSLLNSPNISLHKPYTELNVGMEVSRHLGIEKYEAPIPEEPGAIGKLPSDIFPTDETIWQNVYLIEKYLGRLVDVSLKVDGSSQSFYYRNGDFKILSRTLEYDINKINKRTSLVEKFDIQNKLKTYCETHEVNLALRGEMYGQGIQNSKNNPHSKLPLGVMFYSTWLIDEMKYAGKNDKHYFINVCRELDLPYVDILEENVELTESLIKKYDEDLNKVNNNSFEGVVIKGKDFSFKVINKHYDSKK